MALMKPRSPLEQRRAKIICTLGPSTDDPAVLAGLLASGMDGARLNLGFGTREEHAARIQRLRQVMANRPHRPVAIIADLPGKKVRIGQLGGDRIELKSGQELQLVPDAGQAGSAEVIPVGRGFFHENMMRGDKVLLTDGLVELRVRAVERELVAAEVIQGGEVSERTAVHTPGMPLSSGPLGADELEDLRFAIAQEVDYVALTYVADASDILAVRERMIDLGRELPIIAKIERSEAFARLDGILKRSDAVMIRRGDLGAEIEITRVPLVQKEILRIANDAGVPVIIATQMLGSMIAAPTPTRAEASDVSNAIADGADGVLLSAETATGRYPVEAVSMMGRIIRETERSRASSALRTVRKSGHLPFAEATAEITCQAALQCGAKVIACFTESGTTAHLIAKYRPATPLIAFCSSEPVRRYLALTWGVRTDALDISQDVEAMVQSVEARLTARGLVRSGDRVVIAFGAPVGQKGHTNSVRLHEIP